MLTPTFQNASVSDIGAIQHLRSNTDPGDLKDLSLQYILDCIDEFYLAILDSRIVGCFRIFTPVSYPDVLELGSVVSTERGIGSAITHHAKTLVQERNIPLIAVTGGKLDKTLEQHGWELATDRYPARMQESSLDKKLWIWRNS